MKFLVDAQLPRRLAIELAAHGHDVKHTLDLPLGNRTPDGEIAKTNQSQLSQLQAFGLQQMPPIDLLEGFNRKLAARDDCVVATKDSDFVTAFLLHGMPPKLLLISTGNISNDALSRLIAANLATLESTFEKHAFIELSASAITIHA